MQSEEGEILSEGEREEDTSMAEEDAGVADDLPSLADARRTAEQFMEATQKALNLSFRPRVVIPGDDCTTDVCSHSDRVRIGNGLIHGSQGAVRATKAGLLRHHAPNIYRVDNYQRRYIPKAQDFVLGVVEDRQAEAYRVNIFGSVPGLLPHLAFEGATKRNKPNLKVGALVYCRVAVANKDMDPELSCIATHGVKKDWMTGQAVFGELKDGGALNRCSINLCRQLIPKDSLVLDALKDQGLKFEIAVGVNGAFWVKAEELRTTVAITNAILNSEMIKGKGDMIAMVQQVLKAAKRVD